MQSVKTNLYLQAISISCSQVQSVAISCNRFHATYIYVTPAIQNVWNFSIFFFEPPAHFLDQANFGRVLFLLSGRSLVYNCWLCTWYVKMYLGDRDTIMWHDGTSTWHDHVTKYQPAKGHVTKYLLQNSYGKMNYSVTRRQFVVNHEICFAKPKFNFNHVIIFFRPNWASFGLGRVTSYAFKIGRTISDSLSNQVVFEPFGKNGFKEGSYTWSQIQRIQFEKVWRRP